MFTPMTTEIVAGLNEKFLMVTLTVLGAAAASGTKFAVAPAAIRAAKRMATQEALTRRSLDLVILAHKVMRRSETTPTSSATPMAAMNGYALSPMKGAKEAYPSAVPVLCTKRRREKIRSPRGYRALVERKVRA